MTEPVQRRPLPALIFLLAITLLTAIVWWRVATRHDDNTTQDATPSCNASATPSVVPPAKNISLTVLNATTGYPKPLTGIASKAGKAFTAAGFVVAKTDNDNGSGVPGVAVIRFGPTQRAKALLVSYYLPGSQLVQQTNDQDTIVISLGLKYVGVAPTAQVNAALAKDKVTVSTVSPSPGPGC